MALTLAIGTLAFMAPTIPPSKMMPTVATTQISMSEGGKGFGGGEATRDPEPTLVDPNDPKGKQQAIHKAESFAEYRMCTHRSRIIYRPRAVATSC